VERALGASGARLAPTEPTGEAGSPSRLSFFFNYYPYV